jgi:hypothetical protein
MPPKVGSKSETSLNSEEKEEPETSILHPQNRTLMLQLIVISNLDVIDQALHLSPVYVFQLEHLHQRSVWDTAKTFLRSKF